MSLRALHKIALRDTELITITNTQETNGPGGRLVLGSGDSCVVEGVALPVRNRALSGGYSAGAFEGELRKFIFTDTRLTSCQIKQESVLTTANGERFSIIQVEDWSLMGLFVAYGRKLVR